ncbi:hypothetical protein [Mycolicibacterium vaccae]|uniref:hypothetical protein n=1 Tax=Mycolicibacterium vaccae TaxID=1810 RepID=UPI003CFC8308
MPSAPLAFIFFSGMVGLGWRKVKGMAVAKSQGRSLKKPAMTIKEKRAAKRAKSAEGDEFITRRKRPDRSS